MQFALLWCRPSNSCSLTTHLEPDVKLFERAGRPSSFVLTSLRRAPVHNIDSSFRRAGGVPGKAGGAARAAFHSRRDRRRVRDAMLPRASGFDERLAFLLAAAASYGIASHVAPPARHSGTTATTAAPMRLLCCMCSWHACRFRCREHAVSSLAALCATREHTVYKVVASHGQPVCGLVVWPCHASSSYLYFRCERESRER